MPKNKLNKEGKSILPKNPTSSENLVRQLTVATDASIGVIVVRVPETEVYRVVDELYSIAMAQRTDFRLHTSAEGWASYETVDPEDTRAPEFDPLEPKDYDIATADVGKAFAAMSSADTLPQDGYFIMLDLYFSFGEQKTQTCIRKQAQRALSNGQRLFLIVPQHVAIPDAISPLIHVIDYDYPTREELSDSLDDILSALDEKEAPKITDEERIGIISNGQGMTVHSFETACALSITSYSADHESLAGFGAGNIAAMIRDYKTQLLSKTNVLELQDPIPQDEIGGLDLFKEWMVQRKSTFSSDALDFGITPSRGCLVVGPPGTGKSLVAKAAGSILNMPVIRFDVGRVFGSYIGQSEQSMRSVLSMIDAMAPCVLMLDEIDKGFSGMNGGSNSDGGTTQRVFGTFLTWMQERNQRDRPVFLIMTANRVSGLPPELLRKGRVDEIWSVNLPNEVEREQILNIHATRRKQKIGKDDIKSVVRLTDGLVGAEIEALIEDSLVISMSQHGEPDLSYDTIEKAKSYLKPMSDTRAEEFSAMANWAKLNARPASKAILPKVSSLSSKRKVGKRTRVHVTRKK